MSSETVPILARGVSKKFGEMTALESLDLEVPAGQCVGLLGPNGAGKSTFIGCLYGAVMRTGGELRVFGHDPATHARAIKERLGVVTQENALDEELTVMENMRLYARFEGVKNPLPRINQLLADMSLEHKRNEPIRSLSGGMKRRLTFVRALLSDPEILILDEPTTGLDPTVRHVLWEKVQAFRTAGKTVMVTTHYMHEAEILCDKIIILNKGRAIAVGSPRELIEREVPGYIGIFDPDREEELRPHLEPDWQIFQLGRQCCVRVPRMEQVIALQRVSGVPALQMRPGNLEDVYLKLTGHDLSDDE
jgi:lipooligosaccharide transport system ATP-binding protein